MSNLFFVYNNTKNSTYLKIIPLIYYAENRIIRVKEGGEYSETKKIQHIL